MKRLVSVGLLGNAPLLDLLRRADLEVSVVGTKDATSPVTAVNERFVERFEVVKDFENAFTTIV